MKCISCESEINPQWGHAIGSNMCPFCGKSIMDEHLKKLFATLRETMEHLCQYQDQLNDWMLSNHNYIKTDDPDQLVKHLPPEMLKDLRRLNDDRDLQDRKKFTVKVQTETGEQEIEAERLQSENRTNEFFKRAQVIKSVPGAAPPVPDASPVFQTPGEKTKYLKERHNQIRKEGAQIMTDAGGGSMTLPAAMMAEADPEAVAEFQQMISGGENISSSLSDGVDDEVPAGILAANMAAARVKGGSTSNAADLLKLQQMQDRLAQSRANFESGANRSKKGGFSRST